MHPFLIAVMAVTSILFVWGLLSPRSQWQLLVGWTRSNPRESEPGGGAYGVARLLSLVGILGVIAIVAVWAVPRMERPLITVSPPQALVERLWGVPAPVVADRVITPLGSAPDGLVSQRLSGYQLVDSTARTPGYLFTLTAVRGEGLGSEQGFLGGVPAPGTTALDGADFVVGVRVDILCIPQQLVVTQSTTAVQVGVFVGQPGAVSASRQRRGQRLIQARLVAGVFMQHGR